MPSAEAQKNVRSFKKEILVNIKRLMPEFFKAPLRKGYRAALPFLKKLQLTVVYGFPSAIAPHFCPVCKRGLRRFSVIKWDDTMCVFCNSSERHRMAWSFLLRCTDLFEHQSSGPISSVQALRSSLALPLAILDLRY